MQSRILCLVFLAGCGTSGGTADLGESSDLATPGDDMASADLADFPDLSNEPDLATSDLLPAPDLLIPPDLMPPPDLLVPCPARAAGEWHVAPTGSDTPSVYAGNGAAECPVKTIAKAAQMAYTDGFSPGTIFVHAQSGVTPTVYGDGCTGGPPCDTGVTLIAGANQSLTLQGDSPATVLFATANNFAALTVQSSFTGASTTITGLTVQSLLLGLPGTNQGYSININGAAPVTIKEAVVKGTPANISTPGVRDCIGASNGTSNVVVVGPGVTIDGCQIGIGLGSAGVSVTGTVGKPTVVKNSGNVCIEIQGAISGTVTAMNCAGRAVTANTVDGLLVTGGGDGTYEGIMANAVSNSQVTGFAGTGIYANNATIGPNVQVTGTIGTGVRALGTSTTINGLLSTMNQGDGLRCDGIMSLSNAILSGNSGNGLLTTTNCNPTLDTVEFNRTGAKNGKSGLCVLGATGTSVSASSAKFGCGYSGAGCTSSGTPTTATNTSCQTADITSISTITVSTPSAQCCN